MLIPAACAGAALQIATTSIILSSTPNVKCCMLKCCMLILRFSPPEPEEASCADFPSINLNTVDSLFI